MFRKPGRDCSARKARRREVTVTLDDATRILGAKRIRFDGADYSPSRDDARLTGQLLRIFNAMKDGSWRRLADIERITGDPQTSISAQLRHLRKQKFGAHTVNRRYLYDGLYEYQLVVSGQKQLTLIEQ
jgi:hypothetical protein